MAVFEFWRDVTVGSPNDTVTRYQYDTSDDSIASDVFNPITGTLGPIHPAAGTVMYQECDELDLVQYKSTGSSASINKVTIVDSPGCCQIEASDFSVVKANNTSLETPNGTITITSTIEDINEYEASIDGGATWEPAMSDEIVFSGLSAGAYTIIIKAVGSVCAVTTETTINDVIAYPPLIIHEETQPSLYSPVFHPITLGYLLDNNQAAVKQDMTGIYLEVVSADAKDYLATLPIIKILQNEDYAGSWQVVSVDVPGTPTKFYIEKPGGVYTTDQDVLFVPFDRQVFTLYCETSFNSYVKIADITVYPNADGEYLLRLDGFLQAAFKVMQPINMGDDITLLRKYYVVPRDFDMETSATIYNAVYSAVEDLTPYLEDLVPLGPAPINFISELTARGMPVLFSYIDTATGRIKNVTSSAQTSVVATTPEVIIFGLPLNVYDFQWINPAGIISSLNSVPVLPSWITILPSPADTVKLLIDAGADTEGGDYDGDDYDGDDYLVGGPNTIVGCHTFQFNDGVTPLFELTICIFPIQLGQEVCEGENSYNIAWINQQGGWSSYVFEGRKILGVDIGTVKTYKKGRELKRSSVEEVYNTTEVILANKSTRDLDFISSLRTSIQAYMYDPATLQWSIPIVLERQSFEKYSLPFRQIEQEDSFKFRYAQEVLIQSQ